MIRNENLHLVDVVFSFSSRGESGCRPPATEITYFLGADAHDSGDETLQSNAAGMISKTMNFSLEVFP